MTVDELRASIPGPVPVYRATGPVLVVRWRTHDEGGHAIVTTSHKSLLTLFGAVVDEHGDEVEIVAQLSGTAVLPPSWLSEKIRALRYAELLSDFEQDVVGRAHSYRMRCGRLPAILQGCSEYKSASGSKADSIDAGMHYRCLNCDGDEKIMPVGRTWEQYMAEKSYLRPLNYSHSKAWSSKPFEGIVAREDASLLAFTDHFGHHSKGLDAKQIAPEDWPNASAPCLLLQDWKAEIFDDVVALIDAAKADEAAREKTRSEKWESDREASAKKDWENTCAFFGETP